MQEDFTLFWWALRNCALAGIIHAAQLYQGNPNDGVAFELDAIAAVIIGGTAMTGGRGTIWGTVFGAVILGIINNMMNMVGVSPYLQGTVKGLVIIVAVYLQKQKQ